MAQKPDRAQGTQGLACAQEVGAAWSPHLRGFKQASANRMWEIRLKDGSVIKKESPCYNMDGSKNILHGRSHMLNRSPVTVQAGLELTR